MKPKKIFENITGKNFVIDNSVFIPDGNNKPMAGELLKGNIYYNFFNGKHESIKPVEPLEEKINKLCILIVSKNNFAVGLQYICDESTAPVLLLKTYDVKWITKICKRNRISIIFNKKLAEYIFYNNKEYSVVHSDIWEDIAKIFSKLMNKDKTFAKKINYKG